MRGKISRGFCEVCEILIRVICINTMNSTSVVVVIESKIKISQISH
jgi:hypothetical protein